MKKKIETWINRRRYKVDHENAEQWDVHIMIYGDGLETAHINSRGHNNFSQAYQEQVAILNQLNNVEH